MRPALSSSTLIATYNRIAEYYDRIHGLLTLHSDQRGRRLVVSRTVAPGDRVLDCGAGTGSTALLAAGRVRGAGRVMLVDMSEGMLAVARERLAKADLSGCSDCLVGDILRLPFGDPCFDAVVSTYSTCPLGDPGAGAREMYRLVRPGGRLGIAHSVEPRNPILRWLADKVERLAWRFPSISMGCRPVSVWPALEAAGARRVFDKRIGVPLWPFRVLVVEKPDR